MSEQPLLFDVPPMIRDSIHDPWQEVGWDEAFAFAAEKLRGIQEKYGPGGI